MLRNDLLGFFDIFVSPQFENRWQYLRFFVWPRQRPHEALPDHGIDALDWLRSPARYPGQVVTRLHQMAWRDWTFSQQSRAPAHVNWPLQIDASFAKHMLAVARPWHGPNMLAAEVVTPEAVHRALAMKAGPKQVFFRSYKFALKPDLTAVL